MTMLLNETEAAKILGVSVHKLRRDRWAGGGIPFIKMASAVRYRPEDIDGYINSRVRKSTSDTGTHHCGSACNCRPAAA